MTNEKTISHPELGFSRLAERIERLSEEAKQTRIDIEKLKLVVERLVDHELAREIRAHDETQSQVTASAQPHTHASSPHHPSKHQGQ